MVSAFFISIFAKAGLNKLSLGNYSRSSEAQRSKSDCMYSG